MLFYDYLCRLALSITKYWTKCFLYYQIATFVWHWCAYKKETQGDHVTKVAESEMQVQPESTKNCWDLLHNGKGVWNGLSLMRNPLCPYLSQISALQNRGTGNLCCLSPQRVVLCCCSHRKSRPHVSWLGPLHHSVVSVIDRGNLKVVCNSYFLYNASELKT